MSAVLLVAALILAPAIGGGFGELTNAVLQILVFGAVASYFLFFRKAPNAWAKAPGFVPLAVFAILTLISSFFSLEVYSSLKQILFVFACLSAYMLAASVSRDTRAAAAAVWGIAISALLIGVFAIQHYAITTGGGMAFIKSLITPGDKWREFGPFINPNFFSGYLVITLPVTLGVYLVTRRTVLALLTGLAFVFEVLALMLTGAKFGIISAVIALLVFFILAIATKSLRRSKFMRLLIIAVVVVPLLAVFSGSVRGRIREAEAGGTQVHSTEFRIYTWRATANMIKHYPLMGVGPGVYDIAYPRYTIAGPTKYAHNSYLQIGAENGVPALIAFMILLLTIAYRSLVGIFKGSTRTPDRASDASHDHPQSDTITWKDLVPFSAWRLLNCALFAALLGSAIRSLVDSDWYVIGISLPFWVIAGVLVSQAGVADKDITPSKRIAWTKAAVCAVLIILSVSFGLGDIFASHADDLSRSASADPAAIAEQYRLAAQFSPLNPEYHRKLGLFLAVSDPEAGLAEVERAIKLAPRTSEGGWSARGMIDAGLKRWPEAIASFKQSLVYNPNSTVVLENLANAYDGAGDKAGFESTLRRLLEIENSPYEQIKGTPELVDTTFAWAHAYFARKYLAEKKYSRAISEFLPAIERLARWQSNPDTIQLQQFTGMLTASDQRELTNLLRDSYLGLADAYTGIGDETGAREARAKAAKVKDIKSGG